MRRVDVVGMRCALVCVLAGACGRVAFDPRASTDAATDSFDAMPDGTIESAPSCGDLPETCGPAGTSSCCPSPLISGGTFFRSYDVGTDNAFTDMTNPATVSDFRLDMYEVTVGRFRQFVVAGGGTQQSPPDDGAGARTLNGLAAQGGWDPAWNALLAVDSAALAAGLRCAVNDATWTDTPGANESLPINCITWYEAFAFCVWDGGFLPTEAEWNYAAVGGSEHRAYPWSSPPSSLTIDCSYANYNSTTGSCADGPFRVGTASVKGAGRWGHADFAGNVWEWELDWFQTAYINPCNDCARLTSTVNRAIRGGMWGNPAANTRGAARLANSPDGRYEGLGVRCARRP